MRTFVAIDLPESLKEKIGKFEKEIRGVFPLRFVSPENLHLTLFFLGDLPDGRVEEVKEAVKVGVWGIKPFFLSLGKPEFFPNKGRIHGLWFGIEGERKNLEKLYQNLFLELEKRNFAFDRRPFLPHVTIGRVKGKIKNKEFSFREFKKENFKVESVSVFGSILKPSGPIYQKEEEIFLIS